MLGRNIADFASHTNSRMSRRARFKLPILLPVVIAVIAASWAAAAGRWVGIGPQQGGLIESIAVDPSNVNIVYVATNRGIFKSTDGGDTWKCVNNEKPLVWRIAVSPQNPLTVYACTEYGGWSVLKSTDGGVTWSKVDSGLGGWEIDALAISPTNSNIVYLGTAGGVYVTDDGGANWGQFNNGLTSTDVLSLAIDPVTPGTIYAGTYGGVYKSTNGGLNWNPVSTGLTNLQVRALAVHPTIPNTLYAGTATYVFKSVDGGLQWNATSSGEVRAIYALAIDPQNPSTVFAASTDYGVFKTANGGTTWSAFNSGLTNTKIVSLAIGGNPSVLYGSIETSGASFFKTSTTAASWIAKNSGLGTGKVNALAFSPTNPATLYAATTQGVFKSSDRGASWQAVTTGLSIEIRALAIDALSPDTVYAGTWGLGVYKSTNGGGSWARVYPASPASTYVLALAADPNSGGRIYASIQGGGIFKTNDGGTNWSEANSGLANKFVPSLVIDPKNSNTLYAALMGGAGVFKSVNGGESWSAASNGLSPHLTMTCLAVDPQNSNTLYAGSESGKGFKSVDGGANWGLIYSGSAFKALAVDPQSPSTVLGGSYGRGVFRSTDGGANWSADTIGLTSLNILALSIDPQSPAGNPIVFAGTESGGVCVTSAEGTDQVTVKLSPGGAGTTSTLGSTGALAEGYAITANSGAAPYGTAVFSYRQNNVVVAEVGVPASPPTVSMRFFIESRTAVPPVVGPGVISTYTGFAAVNMGTATANINLKLRDGLGNILAQGSIPPLGKNKHISVFPHELAPGFVLPAGFVDNGEGTLELTSDQPLSGIAIRGTANQRGEVLVSTTPVGDLSQPLPSGAQSFAMVADVAGYQTTLILMNTSGGTESGTVFFYSNSGAPLMLKRKGDAAAASQFAYSIPKDGFVRIVTDGSPAGMNVGWAQLVPSAGAAPVGAALFGYTQGGVLVTES